MLSPFPTVFQMAFSSGAAKLVTVFKRQILDSSKLKESADNNFKFEENCGKFSKKVEYTEKEEIACYEQFLLFPQCFQKTFTRDM